MNHVKLIHGNFNQCVIVFEEIGLDNAAILSLSYVENKTRTHLFMCINLLK